MTRIPPAANGRRGKAIGAQAAISSTATSYRRCSPWSQNAAVAGILKSAPHYPRDRACDR
jgi:hypothetical protein